MWSDPPPTVFNFSMGFIEKFAKHLVKRRGGYLDRHNGKTQLE
jgi:hypothetical protein